MPIWWGLSERTSSQVNPAIKAGKSARCSLSSRQDIPRNSHERWGECHFFFIFPRSLPSCARFQLLSMWKLSGCGICGDVMKMFYSFALPVKMSRTTKCFRDAQLRPRRRGYLITISSLHSICQLYLLTFNQADNLDLDPFCSPSRLFF